MEERIYKLLDLLLGTGQLLLENGAETYRAENAVLFMFDGLGEGYVDVFALATMITIDIVVDGRHYTGTRRIRKRLIDLRKIERINSVSRDVCGGLLTSEQALNVLSEIELHKENKPLIILASGMAAGLFSLLMGGGAVEFSISAFCCAAVQAISVLSKKTVMFYFLISFLGGLIPALTSVVAFALFHCGNVNLITLGSMLPLFPGVAMVNAIRDTMNGDLVSGVARGNEAILTAVGLAVGAAVGMSAGVLL